MFGLPGARPARRRPRRGHGRRATASIACCGGPTTTQADLKSGLRRASARQGADPLVPRGTVLLQAIPADFAIPSPIGHPNAQFFVLKDDVAVSGSEITDPQQSTDEQRHTRHRVRVHVQRGRSEFQKVTAPVARRGFAGQRTRSDAQPALRGGAGRPADHESRTIATSSTRTGSTATTAADISGSFTITLRPGL